MITHIVTKPLPKGEVVLQPGDEVDASDWKRVTSLEEQRYIKPIQPNDRVERMGRKEKDANTRN